MGCASCHVPTLKTGPNEISALSRKTVHLYSDLLLHDLGPEYRGVCAGDASPTEFRTGRLTGYRFREPYSLEAGGEALGARMGYEDLSPRERSLLLRFLRSL